MPSYCHADVKHNLTWAKSLCTQLLYLPHSLHALGSKLAHQTETTQTTQTTTLHAQGSNTDNNTDNTDKTETMNPLPCRLAWLLVINTNQAAEEYRETRDNPHLNTAPMDRDISGFQQQQANIFAKLEPVFDRFSNVQVVNWYS